MSGIDSQETYPYQGFPSSGSRLRLSRLIVRILSFVLVLGGVDAVVGKYLPEPDPSAGGRMPRTLPTSALPGFVRHVERDSRPPKLRAVAFIGASPAWGDAVREDSLTVPAQFERIATARGGSTRVYNLACNGQLVGDSYFVARRVADDVDLVVVQLTYHSFNPAWREGTRQRYPELPRMLAVSVDAQSSRVLGCEQSPKADLTGAVDRWLQANWRLYGARDRLMGVTVGSTPESALFERWQMLTMPGFEGEQEYVPAGSPFDELSPDEQMLAMDEFSSAGVFNLDEDDSEVLMLDRLCEDLASEGVRAVFYMSPVNKEALESFGLFDAEQYEANVSVLRAIVAKHGHQFIDMNTEATFPSSAFADINHTTADGSRMVAEELAQRIEGEAARR